MLYSARSPFELPDVLLQWYCLVSYSVFFMCVIDFTWYFTLAFFVSRFVNFEPILQLINIILSVNPVLHLG